MIAHLQQEVEKLGNKNLRINGFDISNLIIVNYIKLNAEYSKERLLHWTWHNFAKKPTQIGILNCIDKATF